MCPKQTVVTTFPLVENFRFLKAQELSPDQNQAIDHLPRKTGLNIMRDRDLHSAVVTSQGNPVAGLWTSWYAERFTFDVVVDDSVRGNGLAKHLVHHAICSFNSARLSYQDPFMVIKVVNPVMRQLLEEHFGFSVALESSHSRWEMIPNTDENGAVITPPAEETFAA
jgi:predicted GNAT family acetyltransferase